MGVLTTGVCLVTLGASVSCGSDNAGSVSNGGGDPVERCDQVDPSVIAELFGFTETSVSTSQTITQFTVSPELSFTFTGCTYSNGSYIDDPSQQTCAELSIKYVTEASDGSGETIPSAEVPAVAKASFKQKATEHSADDNDDTATVVEELPAVADGSFMVTQRSMLGEVIYAFAPWSDTTVVVTLRDACTDEPLQAGTVVGVLDRFVNGAA